MEQGHITGTLVLDRRHLLLAGASLAAIPLAGSGMAVGTTGSHARVGTGGGWNAEDWGTG